MKDEWAVQAEVTGSGHTVVRKRPCVGCMPVGRVYDQNVCGRGATCQKITRVNLFWSECGSLLCTCLIVCSSACCCCCCCSFVSGYAPVVSVDLGPVDPQTVCL